MAILLLCEWGTILTDFVAFGAGRFSTKYLYLNCWKVYLCKSFKI